MKARFALFAFILFVSAFILPTPALADGIIVPDPPICLPDPCPPAPVPISQLEIRYHHVDIVIDDQIHTPRLDDCGIAGTRRQLVIERWAPAAGYLVNEAELDWSALQAAREVFLSNTLWGLRPVGSLGELRWEKHDVCRDLQRQYRETPA